jgi:hypothetical protein
MIFETCIKCILFKFTPSMLLSLDHLPSSPLLFSSFWWLSLCYFNIHMCVYNVILSSCPFVFSFKGIFTLYGSVFQHMVWNIFNKIFHEKSVFYRVYQVWKVLESTKPYNSPKNSWYVFTVLSAERTDKQFCLTRPVFPIFIWLYGLWNSISLALCLSTFSPEHSQWTLQNSNLIACLWGIYEDLMRIDALCVLAIDRISCEQENV